MKRLSLAFTAFLCAALPAAALTGCAAIEPLPHSETQRQRAVSYEIGLETTSRTGEPMAVEEELLFHQAFVARADFQIPPQLGSTYPAIRYGMEFIPYGRLGNGDSLLRSVGLKPRSSNGEPVAWEYCIAVDQGGEAYGDAACALGVTRRWERRPENLLEKKRVYREGSSRKELLYGGRAGDTIRVAYRETRGGLFSQAFQQELVYDLSESGVIRFRGMVIEVLEATNGHIRYIVRSGMEGAGPEPSKP